MSTLSKRELAKHATAFATECVLTEKVLTLGYSVCKRAGPLVVEVFELLKKEPAVEYAVAGAEGMVHKMSNATKNVGGAAKEVIKDAQLVLKSFHAEYMAKLGPEIAQLRNMFDCTKKGLAKFTNKWIKIAYEHVLGMELTFNKKGKPKFSGCHHDFMKTIEKSNLFQFSNKKIYKSGFYAVDIIMDGVKFPKTFFPADWSRKKVVEKIFEAYSEYFRRGVIPKQGTDGKYIISGFIREGIEIKMCFTEKGKMVTAYPVLK